MKKLLGPAQDMAEAAVKFAYIVRDMGSGNNIEINASKLREIGKYLQTVENCRRVLEKYLDSCIDNLEQGKISYL